jgi:hypothetical protein
MKCISTILQENPAPIKYFKSINTRVPHRRRSLHTLQQLRICPDPDLFHRFCYTTPFALEGKTMLPEVIILSAADPDAGTPGVFHNIPIFGRPWKNN